jgi:hypothetical protein
MKLFRKLRAFALLFAVIALAIGFIMLSAPQKADASRPCDCMVRICLVDNPRICWCECVPCPPPPGPPGP